MEYHKNSSVWIVKTNTVNKAYYLVLRYSTTSKWALDFRIKNY